jgi:DNA-directed RNA polymerase specialized sigma24 family protein
LSTKRPLTNTDLLAAFLAEADELRPELHRYCARLMGSVIDGEDVVQDTLIRSFEAL